MLILATGSRTYTDLKMVAKTLHRYREVRGKPEEAIERSQETPTLLHGGADGADKLAEKVARHLGWNIDRRPAEWDRYGKRAGFVRNLKMLDEEPDLVLAFWDGRSKGTAHCIAQAVRRGLYVVITPEGGDDA